MEVDVSVGTPLHDREAGGGVLGGEREGVLDVRGDAFGVPARTIFCFLFWCFVFLVGTGRGFRWMSSFFSFCGSPEGMR